MSSIRNPRSYALQSLWRQRVVWLPLLVAGTSILAGCGGKNPRDRQPVSGSVTLNGGRLEHGVIEFHSQQERGVASGALIENGEYFLPEAKGLPEGSYIVRIYSGKENPPDMRAPDGGELPAPAAELPGVELIPPNFNVFSDIIRKVVADEENRFDFEITTSRR